MREQPVQRPRGRTAPGRNRRERGREGPGQGRARGGCAGPCGHGEDCGFYPEGGGGPGGLWAEEGRGPESGAHRCPLVAAVRKTGCGARGRSQGTGIEVTALVPASDVGPARQRPLPALLCLLLWSHWSIYILKYMEVYYKEYSFYFSFVLQEQVMFSEITCVGRLCCLLILL